MKRFDKKADTPKCPACGEKEWKWSKEGLKCDKCGRKLGAKEFREHILKTYCENSYASIR